MLAKIGGTFPALGDPYEIPLSRLPGLYADAERYNAWRLGHPDPMTPESARHQKMVDDMRRMAKFGKIAPPETNATPAAYNGHGNDTPLSPVRQSPVCPADRNDGPGDRLVDHIRVGASGR